MTDEHNAPTPWRAQRIKRHAMAKQAASKTKKTRQSPLRAKADMKWFDHARGLPLVLLHTTVGPIIGRIERAPRPEHAGHWDYDAPFRLRMWAPAAARMGLMPGQPGVTDVRFSMTFQPLALVETYIDLSSATPFGRSPVPDALVPSYEEYFDKVVAGEYSLNRVAVQVAQAQPHVIASGTGNKAPEVEPEPEPPAGVADDANDARPPGETDDL